MEIFEFYVMCSDGGVGCSYVFNQFGKKKKFINYYILLYKLNKKSKEIFRDL